MCGALDWFDLVQQGSGPLLDLITFPSPPTAAPGPETCERATAYPEIAKMLSVAV
jgi:hypothetical protein